MSKKNEKKGEKKAVKAVKISKQEKLAKVLKGHTNPYHQGSAYFKAFEFLRHAKQATVTREQMVKAGEQGGWTEHDVTVVLSPRADGESRGDCRGNLSSKGEVYFLQTKKVKTTTKKVDGKMTKVDGQPKTFTLRWRKEVLASRSRKMVVEATKPVETPAEKKNKAKATKPVETPAAVPETPAANVETPATPEAATVS